MKCNDSSAKSMARQGDLPNLYRIAGRLIRPLLLLALIAALAGFFVGFGLAPAVAEQAQCYRIIFLHVPVSWLSLVLYLALAACAGYGLWREARSAFVLASAVAPSGALFAFLSLATGALWGKPMWGAWWVWGDTRLTSELILFFLYLGFIALQSAIDDPRRADRAGAILALVGVVNVPIVYFSVLWWNSLHQGPSIVLSEAPSMEPVMGYGILLCALAGVSYAFATVLKRAQLLLLVRESRQPWARAIVAEKG